MRIYLISSLITKMKKYLFIGLLILSVSANIIYFNYLFEQKKHTDEFFSLFKVNEISYQDGFLQLEGELNSINNKKPYHLIHIWDTTGLEFGYKIPYILNADSTFITNPFKKIDCILMSSMSNETIEICLKSRKIHFNSLIIMNEMEEYISGVCNQKGRKTKPIAATLLINQKGDILYYNDKLKYTLEKDAQLLEIINSLK